MIVKTASGLIFSEFPPRFDDTSRYLVHGAGVTFNVTDEYAEITSANDGTTYIYSVHDIYPIEDYVVETEIEYEKPTGDYRGQVSLITSYGRPPTAQIAINRIDGDSSTLCRRYARINNDDGSTVEMWGSWGELLLRDRVVLRISRKGYVTRTYFEGIETASTTGARRAVKSLGFMIFKRDGYEFFPLLRIYKLVLMRSEYIKIRGVPAGYMVKVITDSDIVAMTSNGSDIELKLPRYPSRITLEVLDGEGKVVDSAVFDDVYGGDEFKYYEVPEPISQSVNILLGVAVFAIIITFIAFFFRYARKSVKSMVLT